MAETQSAPATIEVNDAIFCTHLLEVVRFWFPHNRKRFFVFPPWVDLLTSVPIVPSMEEKRTTRSLGWVSPIWANGGSADETFLPSQLQLPPPILSLSSSIVRGLNVLLRPRIKIWYINAKSMGQLVCQIHLLSVSESNQVSDYHYLLGCNQCFGWKKQITRARAQAKKAGRK